MRSKIPASLRSLPARRGDLALGVASAMGLAFAGPATAQAPAQPDPLQVPPITVQGNQERDYKVDRVTSPKMPTPLVDTPKSVVVIPKELIKDQGATTVRDLLRTQPGISMSTAEGGTALGDRIVIRGFDARGDIFIDGMRDPGVTSREVFNIEQVEILKGPSSAYTGRGATGGSVNIVTKVPQATNFYRGDVTLGTDWTKRTTIDVNQVVNDNVAIRINGMLHDQDVAGRDHVFQRRYGFAPSFTIGLNGPTQLTVQYYRLRGKEMPDYGHPFDVARQEPLKVDRDNFYGVKGRDYRKVGADIGTAVFTHEINENLKFRTQSRLGQTTNEYIASAPEQPNLANDTVNANAKQRNSVASMIGNQTDLTWKFDTVGIKHTMIFGTDFARDQVTNRPFTIVPTAVVQNLSNPDFNVPWTGTVTNSGTFTQLRTLSFAPYVFDSIEITDKFLITAGLRWDFYDTTSRATAAAQNGLQNKDNFFNWHLGAVYKPLPNGSVYAAFSSSSNPPGQELDTTSGDFGGIGATNASLKPERNVSYELGTKWDLLNSRLALTGALFLTDKQNARVTVPGGGVQVQEGKQRVYGFEIGTAGRVTKEWQVFGGFTWLHTEVRDSPNPEDDGKGLPNVPKYSFSLWSTYDITDKFTVGALAYYVGRRHGGTFVETSASIDGYWRFDLMAKYKITDYAEVRLNVLNITNKLYYDAIYRSTTTPFAYVGPGRSALLTGSLSF